MNQLENEKSVIYFEKQDIVTNRQAEKYTFKYRQINYYKSEIENLFEDIKRWNKEQKSIYVMVSTKEKAKKLKEILDNSKINRKNSNNNNRKITKRI